MNNLATQILLQQLKAAHTTLEQTMEGVTDQIAHFVPPGKANPIAGTYAHLVFSEDFFIHAFLKKTQPLMETTFKDKTGASEIQPTDWEVAYPKWLKEVKLDTKQFREYAKAVFAESETYVASLTDADLEKDVDMNALGMGKRKASDFIANLITGHVYPIMGEISVLKGIQGLKGYPF
ncbi:MAG: DinB family protein [Candidatus Levyibacteriota bacterium]